MKSNKPPENKGKKKEKGSGNRGSVGVGVGVGDTSIFFYLELASTLL